jgi:hypothetical protein
MLLRRLFRLPIDDRPQLIAGIDAVRRRSERSARSPLRTAVSASVLRPSVATACVPALSRIAETLRDESRPVPDALRRALRAFLTDGARSPLYGRDEWSALLAAEALAERFGSPGRCGLRPA